MVYDLPHSDPYLISLGGRRSVLYDLNIYLGNRLKQPSYRVITSLHPEVIVRDFKVLRPDHMSIPKLDRTDRQVFIPSDDIIHHTLCWRIPIYFNPVQCNSLK